MNTANRPIRVVILSFEGISAFHLAVPNLVLHDAFVGIDNPFILDTVDLGALDTEVVNQPLTSRQIQLLAQAELIIAPSWPDVAQPAPEALLPQLRSAYSRGATLVGLCLGACVLAQTGLLDGRRATTHWGVAEAFAKRYPEVGLDPNPLYIDEGQLVTSAGIAAALDCCLHLVRTRVGGEVATHLSRIMVTAPYRFGGQQQYIPAPMPSRALPKTELSVVLDEVLANLDASYTLDEVAKRCAMSRRSFTRHFKARMGTSFQQWLLSQRLHHSQKLLESTNGAIPQIAELSGFGSESVFRKHFKQAFSVSPTQWRATFSGQIVEL